MVRLLAREAADRALVDALAGGREWRAGDPVPELTVTGPGPGGGTHTVAAPLTSRDGVPLPPEQYAALAAAFGTNPAAADAVAWLRRSAAARVAGITPALS
ncbi:hypothetical protein AB0J72_13585 [Dactylosporangium sp. NPDC049742]|uniref:hypothetical protein n=1 Tax=Dactylosporangium sp. NPDC049742 TaxID=3154737 RepID=UPI00344AD565